MGICVVLNKSTRHIITSKLAVAHSSLSHVCIETDLKVRTTFLNFKLCQPAQLWLEWPAHGWNKRGPTKLGAPTDKVIYRAKHSSSKVQLKKTLSITLSSKESTKWLKARLNIFSKSHSHWSHLSQCISLKSWAISSTDFPLAVFSHQSQIQFEWLLSFFWTREKGEAREIPGNNVYIFEFVCL